MKYSIYFLVALATIVVSNAQTNTSLPVINHTVVFGQRITGDALLVRKVVYVPAVQGEVVRTDYLYDQRGSLTPARISQVVATDEATDSMGGYAWISQGGPGFTYVGLNFYSTLSKDIRFTVDVYGK